MEPITIGTLEIGMASVSFLLAAIIAYLLGRTGGRRVEHDRLRVAFIELVVRKGASPTETAQILAGMLGVSILPENKK